MRILLLIPTLTGAGAERQLAYLGSELQRRGHDVLVGFVYNGVGEWTADVPTHRFPSYRPWSPRLIAASVRLMRAWKPDVVQTCLTRMDVAGGIAALLARVPFVIREPNSRESYRDLKSSLRRVVGRRAAAIVANSSEGAAYWRNQRTFLIPNAVPAAAIASVEPIARPDGVALALYVGRLEREKNVDVVLRACAAVMSERELLLTICGQGPERERLEALARELRIETRVRFAGFVENAWSHQRAADVVLLLSDFEGNPNVVSECFAAGTPMILSDIAAHRNLAGDDALFVPPRDASATAAAIRNVLDDRPSALERAGRARTRVGQTTIAAMAAAYENVYAIVAAE